MDRQQIQIIVPPGEEEKGTGIPQSNVYSHFIYRKDIQRGYTAYKKKKKALSFVFLFPSPRDHPSELPVPLEMRPCGR